LQARVKKVICKINHLHEQRAANRNHERVARREVWNGVVVVVKRGGNESDDDDDDDGGTSLVPKHVEKETKSKGREWVEG